MAKDTAVDSDKKWKIESDLRSLREAAEIVDDPKRFKAAMKLAEEQQDDMGNFIKMSKGLRSKS